ncbi:transposase [Daejeonella sp.]|uniref:transposase n=1 Tax=Daejeonella sp. TaxID=2805397 RepID=UPI00272F9CD2|nr:transposase [Daejeonella sp.]MDP2414646.1 transposase [Daejeonella sp.]
MQRAKELAFGLLSCTGRLTVTGMLIAVGKQFVDWTAAYQLFMGTRIDITKIFEVSSQVCLENLEAAQMLIVHMDDTIIRKVGRKIAGTAWRRDPLGPAFHTNFIWAQRFIQLSLSLHDKGMNCQSRAIPVDFHHSPSVQKPSKNGTEEGLLEYKKAKKAQNLSKQGLERIKLFRARLDAQGAQERELFLSVDGGYTNETILKGLPDRVTLIGRIRKDAHLHYLPETEKTQGRNRIYGEPVPTPEQIRQSDAIPWVEVEAFAAGKSHTFNVKIVKSLKWRAAGGNHLLQLVVIRPLGYRLKKGGRMLYRKPAYLICTDNDLSIDKLLQAYIWRWEIEVNFREEKTTNGCGDAQVRNEISAAKLPAFVVAMHAFLHLADHILTKQNANLALPKAKWEERKPNQRASTNNLLNLFRGHYWYGKLGKSFSGFVTNQHQTQNAHNPLAECMSAVFYMRK